MSLAALPGAAFVLCTCWEMAGQRVWICSAVCSGQQLHCTAVSWQSMHSPCHDMLACVTCGHTLDLRQFSRLPGVQVTYEAYSASGSGFIVECLTDNPNRSACLTLP